MATSKCHRNVERRGCPNNSKTASHARFAFLTVEMGC
jgi:hypothetical protein